MKIETPINREMAPARRKLPDAALALIREKGYASTTIDELFTRAGVTTGSFGTSSKTKRRLWSQQPSIGLTRPMLFSRQHPSTSIRIDGVLGSIDFRKSILSGDLAECTCLGGAMVQETDASHPAIRNAAMRPSATPRES
jgi:TetR/AcrR family transcriptional repressor of nem operon